MQWQSKGVQWFRECHPCCRYRGEQYDVIFEYSSGIEWFSSSLLSLVVLLYSLFLVFTERNVAWFWLSFTSLCSLLLCILKFHSVYLVLNFPFNEVSIVTGRLFNTLWIKREIGDFVHFGGIQVEWKQIQQRKDFHFHRLVIVWNNGDRPTPLVSSLTTSELCVSGQRNRRLLSEVRQWWNSHTCRLHLQNCEFGGSAPMRISRRNSMVGGTFDQQYNENHHQHQKIKQHPSDKPFSDFNQTLIQATQDRMKSDQIINPNPSSFQSHPKRLSSPMDRHTVELHIGGSPESSKARRKRDQKRRQRKKIKHKRERRVSSLEIDLASNHGIEMMDLNHHSNSIHHIVHPNAKNVRDGDDESRSDFYTDGGPTSEQHFALPKPSYRNKKSQLRARVQRPPSLELFVPNQQQSRNRRANSNVAANTMGSTERSASVTGSKEYSVTEYSIQDFLRSPVNGDESGEPPPSKEFIPRGDSNLSVIDEFNAKYQQRGTVSRPGLLGGYGDGEQSSSEDEGGGSVKAETTPLSRDFPLRDYLSA